MKRYIVLLLLLGACGHPEDNLKQDGETLATLNCRAKKLQDERFKLADDIRFAEDSLLEGKGDTLLLKKRLAVLNGQIEGLHQRTRIVADSFTLVMGQLHQARYKEPASRKALDTAVQNALSVLCK
ncbi:MAG: hypothetical protein J0L99_02685 [Chitinophagales bacterium]|nr:hypothetical protein [Chitinophagales bacterium]